MLRVLVNRVARDGDRRGWTRQQMEGREHAVDVSATR